MLNVDDVSLAVREMERCANLGLVGAMITVYTTEDRAYDSPEYEPLWASAQDLHMPLSLHIGTNRADQNDAFVNSEETDAAFFTNVKHWVRISLAHMKFSSVFERYPRLQVGSIEMELSWVPHVLDRLDYYYTQRPKTGKWHTFKEDMMPSDYFHRNVFLGFQEDALGVNDRHIIGVDNLLWGSDYPQRRALSHIAARFWTRSWRSARRKRRQRSSAGTPSESTGLTSRHSFHLRGRRSGRR